LSLQGKRIDSEHSDISVRIVVSEKRSSLGLLLPFGLGDSIVDPDYLGYMFSPVDVEREECKCLTESWDLVARKAALEIEAQYVVQAQNRVANLLSALLDNISPPRAYPTISMAERSDTTENLSNLQRLEHWIVSQIQD
jgi:hypothetical protein